MAISAWRIESVNRLKWRLAARKYQACKISKKWLKYNENVGVMSSIGWRMAWHGWRGHVAGGINSYLRLMSMSAA
jgi:hypothetical protein